MVLLYGAVLLVFITKSVDSSAINGNTRFLRPKRDKFDTGLLASLIHFVVESDEVHDGNTFQKSTQLDHIPLDVDIFESRLKNALKVSSQKLEPGSDAAEEQDLRVHLIKNPEILRSYQRKVKDRHISTSSSSGYDDSLEYDRNAAHVRRNAVFRLGKPAEHIIQDNPKFALRNAVEFENRKHKNRFQENSKVHFDVNEELNPEDIQADSFEDTKHAEFNEKSRYSDVGKLHRYRDTKNEKHGITDDWDNLTKNSNKWDESDNQRKSKRKENHKKNEKRKKKDTYDIFKKDKSGDYSDWNTKKNKEFNVGDNRHMNNERYENSWDNWKPKSTEQNENKRGSVNWNSKKTDDFEKSKENNYGNKNKKSNDWNKPKKNDWGNPKKDWKNSKQDEDWDKPVKNDWGNPKKDWENNKRDEDWDKPMKNDWDNPKKDWKNNKRDEDWDKPKRNENWDDPKKDWKTTKREEDWDKPKKKNWDKSSKNDYDYNWDSGKKKKGSLEQEKNDYNEKDFNKETTKRTTNEWDKAASKNFDSFVKPKPYIPKISDYYNPRPRIHDNPGVLGFKPFGRTSIPFVGKRGIYEEVNK